MKVFRVLICVTCFGCATSAAGRGERASPIGEGRPMRVVAPFPPGSAGDIIPRALVPGFSEALKQTLFVENRPGAAGAIAAETVAKIPANGTTLLFGTTGTLAINPALYPKLPYDPLKDFAPIVLCATSPQALGVDVAWSSPEEFTAQIREELAKWTRAAKGMRAAAD